MLFEAVTTLKKDHFSETKFGYIHDENQTKAALRIPIRGNWFLRIIAAFLMRLELRALKVAAGIDGVPQVLRADKDGILRTWIAGTTAYHSKPAAPAWHRDSRRLLRELRRRGLTHNDTAKAQNWLVCPDGRAGLIDFQLAIQHNRRGKLFRVMAREDLRHLLKHKRAYAPATLTASERRLLARKSVPVLIWSWTGKRIYTFITRQVIGWADREGLGIQSAEKIEYLRDTLAGISEVKDASFHLFALPSHGRGVYVFVETELSTERLRTHVTPEKSCLLHPVRALPRTAAGEVREDILSKIARNTIDDLDLLLGYDQALTELCREIVEGRQNLSDRILKKKPVQAKP